jgi:hypothetical protein
MILHTYLIFQVLLRQSRKNDGCSKLYLHFVIMQHHWVKKSKENRQLLHFSRRDFITERFLIVDSIFALMQWMQWFYFRFEFSDVQTKFRWKFLYVVHGKKLRGSEVPFLRNITLQSFLNHKQRDPEFLLDKRSFLCELSIYSFIEKRRNASRNILFVGNYFAGNRLSS